MPPEVFNPTFCTPKICPSALSRSENPPQIRKQSPLKRMEVAFTTKRFIHTFVFILACLSIFRLLRFAISSYSSSQTSMRTNVLEFPYQRDSFLPSSGRPITKKEYRFLSTIISQRVPCNILIFGWEPQYRRLAKMNAAGSTVFLEDHPERVRMRKLNSTTVYKVNYDVPAKEAFELLKHAREEIDCAPNSGPVETSACKLALTNLPNMVYGHNWDVILVDGPSSDKPEAPGRMAAIYTASIMARAGNITTNVVVHDVDRMIEKWFSWEFLCEENLVSSKGRYWNFRIQDGMQSTSTRFCSHGSLSKE